eukprot:4430715-Pyramimonas_sp.AAC.1
MGTPLVAAALTQLLGIGATGHDMQRETQRPRTTPAEVCGHGGNRLPPPVEPGVRPTHRRYLVHHWGRRPDLRGRPRRPAQHNEADATRRHRPPLGCQGRRPPA